MGSQQIFSIMLSQSSMLLLIVGRMPLHCVRIGHAFPFQEMQDFFGSPPCWGQCWLSC